MTFGGGFVYIKAMRNSREQLPVAAYSYAPSLAALICQEVASGASLTELCQRPGYPHAPVFFEWLTQEPELARAYDLARKSRADLLLREALGIADDASEDWVEVPRRDGRVETVLAHEHVQRSKLRVQTRQWLAARLDRDAYGDKKHIDVDARIMTIDLTDEELNKRLKAARARVEAIEIETTP